MSGGTPQDPSDEREGRDEPPSGPAPHRAALWKAIFVIIVVLGVAVTVVGITTDQSLAVAAARTLT